MRMGYRSLFSLTSWLLAVLHLTQRTLGNVTWTSPSNGDVFGPGDTIVGKWSSPRVVLSPTFRLCFSDSVNNGIGARDPEIGCGLHMSPDVETSGNSYLILLSVLSFS